MSRLYIFTCGTSLMTNFGRSDGDADPLLHTRRSNGLKTCVERIPSVEAIYSENNPAWRSLTQPLIQSDSNLAELLLVIRSDLARDCVTYWSNLKSADKAEQSAELATFETLGVRAGDEIVLLASDTKMGLFCALVNAHVMAGKMQTRQPGSRIEVEVDDRQLGGKAVNPIRWLDVPAGAPANPGLSIRVIVIKNLDPRHKHDFENSGTSNLIQALTDLIFTAYHQGKEPDLVFSGGFKVGIPVLVQSASWLGGLTGQTIAMTALFEASSERITIPIISQRPDEQLMLHAFSFGISQRPYDLAAYPQFKDADCINVIKTTDVRVGECSRLFQDKPRGGIELNPLGHALKKIVEHVLATKEQKEDLLARLIQTASEQ